MNLNDVIREAVIEGFEITLCKGEYEVCNVTASKSGTVGEIIQSTFSISHLELQLNNEILQHAIEKVVADIKAFVPR